LKKIVFVEKSKVIQTVTTNWHKASVLISAQYITLNGRDYEVECNKVNLDSETLEIWLKDITI